MHGSRTNIHYVLTATLKAGYAWHLPWWSTCMIHKIYHLVPISFHVHWRPKPTWINICSPGLYGRICSQWVFGNCDCRLVVAHCHVTLPYIVSRHRTLSTIDPNCHILEHAGVKRVYQEWLWCKTCSRTNFCQGSDATIANYHRPLQNRLFGGGRVEKGQIVQ